MSLLGVSEHADVRCKCPLMTQSNPAIKLEDDVKKFMDEHQELAVARI